MEEPSRPSAAAKRWMITTVTLAAITAIAVAIYVTDLLDANITTWLLPRIWQLVIYLLAIASAAAANRWNAETIRAHIDRRSREARAHIDRRVAETARRMDARLARITRGMDRAGIQLEEVTGEIKRVQADVELDGYAKGFADGIAQTPSGSAKVVRRLGPAR